MDKDNKANSKAAYITAIVSFCIGWGLVCLGFFTPPKGEIHGSVIAILGEAMVYAASVFGVTLYFQNQMAKFRHDARHYLDNRLNEQNYEDEDGDLV